MTVEELRALYIDDLIIEAESTQRGTGDTAIREELEGVVKRMDYLVMTGEIPGWSKGFNAALEQEIDKLREELIVIASSDQRMTVEQMRLASTFSVVSAGVGEYTAVEIERYTLEGITAAGMFCKANESREHTKDSKDFTSWGTTIGYRELVLSGWYLNPLGYSKGTTYGGTTIHHKDGVIHGVEVMTDPILPQHEQVHV